MTALCKGCLTPPVERRRCSTSGNICMATWYRNKHSFYINQKIRHSLNKKLILQVSYWILFLEMWNWVSRVAASASRTRQSRARVRWQKVRRGPELLRGWRTLRWATFCTTCLCQLLLKCYWPKFLQIRWAGGDRQHHSWGKAVVSRPPWENQIITIVTIIKLRND